MAFGARWIPVRSEATARLAWQLLVVALPLLPILFARNFLNETVEAGLVDFDFFHSNGLSAQVPKSNLPAAVVLPLYYLGVAYAATTTIGIVLVLFCLRTIARVWSGPNRRTGAVVLFAVAVILGWVVHESGWPTVDPSIVGAPAYVARQLVNSTLQALPECPPVSLACGPGIGNTGSSVKDMLATPVALLTLGGLLYIAAVAMALGAGTLPDEAAAVVRSLTLMAAITFVATVVTVHVLFLPGRAMIFEAYAVVSKDAAWKDAGEAALHRYDVLSGAMVFYWGAVFSMALAATHFPAMAYLGRNATGGTDLAAVSSTARAVVVTLAPLIGGAAAGLLQFAADRFLGGS